MYHVFLTSCTKCQFGGACGGSWAILKVLQTEAELVRLKMPKEASGVLWRQNKIVTGYLIHPTG